MPFTDADYRDMQGLLRFGYVHLTEACFLLLRIEDAAAAGHWLESAPVATAEEQKPSPKTALQIALTCEGLRKLGLPEDLLSGFSAEFLSGMSGDENRSRRLGDVGENAPSYCFAVPQQRISLLVQAVELSAHKPRALYKFKLARDIGV